jgi:hypothetical protein
MLFPYGTYQHQVKLEVQGRTYQFPGLNRWTKEDLSLVALGAFDVTLLKYQETFKNNKKEIYLDKTFIPLNEEKALMYLSIVKDLYSLDHSICQKKLCRKSFYGQEFLMDLSDTGEVSQIRLSRGEMKITIEVMSYEKIL